MKYFVKLFYFPICVAPENDVFTAHCTWGDKQVESSQT